MKSKWMIGMALILAIGAWCCGLAQAQTTSTLGTNITSGTLYYDVGQSGDYFRHDFLWKADSGGAVTENGSFAVVGQIVRITTIPSATAQPDDDYDITLLDMDGFDLAGGGLANRDEAAVESIVPTVSSLPCYSFGPVQVRVNNAGANAEGIIRAIVRR